MNKCRAPKIPPIFDTGVFILNCQEKAKLFNDHFAKQCFLILNDSILPEFSFITDKRISSISITDENILSLVRDINPNKAAGSDGISGQMLLICDSSVILPFKLVYKSILSTSVYPDMWKLANVHRFSKKKINN